MVSASDNSLLANMLFIHSDCNFMQRLIPPHVCKRGSAATKVTKWKDWHHCAGHASSKLGTNHATTRANFPRSFTAWAIGRDPHALPRSRSSRSLVELLKSSAAADMV